MWNVFLTCHTFLQFAHPNPHLCYVHSLTKHVFPKQTQDVFSPVFHYFRISLTQFQRHSCTVGAPSYTCTFLSLLHFVMCVRYGPSEWTRRCISILSKIWTIKFFCICNLLTSFKKCVGKENCHLPVKQCRSHSKHVLLTKKILAL